MGRHPAAAVESGEPGEALHVALLWHVLATNLVDFARCAVRAYCDADTPCRAVAVEVH